MLMPGHAARLAIVRDGVIGQVSLAHVSSPHLYHAPVSSPLVRRRAGTNLDLEGVDLDHISFDGKVLYRNEFFGARFSEDDLAVASLTAAMSAWCRGEAPAPYPLADGCQDHVLSLAIGEPVRVDGPVTTSREAWAS